MKNETILKKVLFFFILFAFLSNLLFRIFSYSKEYLTPYNSKYWKERYMQSQWVDPLSKNSIGDDGLYAYAAWEYIHGKDPTLINAEMPFLGKYILGLTILIFHNQNIFALIIGVSVLFTLYLLNLKIFKDSLLAAIPVVIFSFEPLFYEQLRAPFLDLLQLLFLILTFYFAARKNFIISSIFLGCFASTKFPFLSVLPAWSIIGYLFITKQKKQVVLYCLTLTISAVIYIATYLQYFLLGNSFISFLKVQKYILNFYASGAKAPFIGTIFPMIFNGTWFTHFSTQEYVSEWTVVWPVALLFSFAACLYLIKRNISTISILLIWVILYLLFLSFTPPFPRYLLLLLPFLYTISVWVIIRNTASKLLS